MTNEERDIQRKLRAFQHAGKIGNARKTCRYFAVGRSGFYRWREACQKRGKAGLKNARSIPKSPPTKHLPRLSGRFCICVVSITWGQSGSSGIWRVITASKFGCGGLPHSKTEWPQPTAQRHADAQTPHQTLSETGSWASPSNRC